ncbi:MAG: DUF948 domain-containing protein [Acidimicrobiia bacterium]|nr:DUF948 domain-containing protein [Acidimicrobiia bacterium]
MSAGDLAVVVVTITSVAAVVVLLFAAWSLLRVVGSLRDTVEQLQLETVPAVAELRRAATQTNVELERVDRLLDRADAISTTVDSASRLTYLVVSNPLIKAMAFASGTSRAARRLRNRG